jgi:hypothetical protein
LLSVVNCMYGLNRPFLGFELPSLFSLSPNFGALVVPGLPLGYTPAEAQSAGTRKSPVLGIW